MLSIPPYPRLLSTTFPACAYQHNPFLMTSEPLSIQAKEGQGLSLNSMQPARNNFKDSVVEVFSSKNLSRTPIPVLCPPISKTYIKKDGSCATSMGAQRAKQPSNPKVAQASRLVTGLQCRQNARVCVDRQAMAPKAAIQGGVGVLPLPDAAHQHTGG